MPYADNTITIQGAINSATFYDLLLVLLCALFLNSLINLILDKIRLEKTEICIHLIEKGHNRAMTGVSLAENDPSYSVENINERDGELLRLEQSKKRRKKQLAGKL